MLRCERKKEPLIGQSTLVYCCRLMIKDNSWKKEAEYEFVIIYGNKYFQRYFFVLKFNSRKNYKLNLTVI